MPKYFLWSCESISSISLKTAIALSQTNRPSQPKLTSTVVHLTWRPVKSRRRSGGSSTGASNAPTPSRLLSTLTTFGMASPATRGCEENTPSAANFSPAVTLSNWAWVSVLAGGGRAMDTQRPTGRVRCSRCSLTWYDSQSVATSPSLLKFAIVICLVKREFKKLNAVNRLNNIRHNYVLKRSVQLHKTFLSL